MKSLKKLFAIALIGVMVFFLAACGGSVGNSGEGKEEANTAEELNIYMWSNYLSRDLVDRFTEETGIQVNFSYMSTSEEAAAEIISGNGGYDLVMPCDADMAGLIEGGYLEEINLENLGDIYKYREFDPENKYAIPYLMNYVYVVYNPETCPIEIDEYQDLLDPALEGQIASVTGPRNLFPIALVSLGYDPNSQDEDEIAEAYEWLRTYVSNVAGLDSDSVETMLINDVASVGFLFDGQASRGFSKMDEDGLVVAELKDAVQLGIDEFVIPKGAKNKENAEKFLNFLLDAENMAENLQTMMDVDGQAYACPNDAAVALMGDEYKNAPALDIPQAVKENYFLQMDIGEAAAVYDKYWDMLMTEEQ